MTYSLRTASEADAERIAEDWGNLHWLASKGIGNADGVTVGRVVIKPGQSNPRHSHSTCEEVLYLLSAGWSTGSAIDPLLWNQGIR